MEPKGNEGKGSTPLFQSTSDDPLEALLDAEDDESFGLPDLKNVQNQELVKLADWTARDFSSCYVRFRPHLERHARRFLNNQSQVDEVVQDAFLYLMVSLPELDSELGVLRFLKWKTRLLALDVIRANNRAYLSDIDSVPEIASDDPEVTDYLEQQDDAAIVKLALAKLNPRHREILVASIYQEKSTEQIATDLRISENAARQLLFRARAAFKKALVGEIDTKGMSASAILSVAARKAWQEGKKAGAATMGILVLLVGSMFGFSSFREPAPDATLSQPTETKAPISPSSAPVVPSQESSPEASDAQPAETDALNEAPKPDSDVSPKSTPSATPSSEPIITEDPVSLASLSKILDRSFSTTLLNQEDFRVNLVSKSGISANLNFIPTDKVGVNPFREVLASFTLDEIQYFASPRLIEWYSVTESDSVDLFVYFGSLEYLFDENDRVWSNSELAKGTIRIDIRYSKLQNQPISAQISLISKG